MKKTYVIAGGGTGGHLFPAMAVAQSLKALEPNSEIIFVGTAAGLEAKYVPAAGYQLYLLPVGKLNLKGQWLEKIKTLIRLPMAFLRSAQILIRHSPDAVLGVGGYASGPFVLMASLMGYHTALWEPNALPGLTNRWLARFVDRCFVVFDEAQKHLQSKTTLRLGIPLRAEIEERAQKSEGEVSRQSAGEPFKIFCFGGSQGSRVINNALFEVLMGLPKGQFKVIHQIGSTDWKIFESKYGSHLDWITPVKFVDDMAEKYQWADLVISRAGASTVAELAAFQKASILIPLPGADAHQEKNAQSIQDSNAGVCILQKELTVDRLKAEILKLQSSSELRKQMSSNIKSFYEPNASQRIASALTEIVGS
jgi:UDP-N-acetylglucosamine--N-acetylmuramyl-(pentapeptide) pyrophosphoryl-undecaprenol N-acetylglucosamine transferase